MLSKPANTANRKTFQMKKVAGRRNYFLLLVLLDTGLRAGEISRLNINDYNQTTGEIRVRPFGTGKKTKPRTVYLGKTAKRAAWRYLAERKIEDTLHPDDPLFVTSDGRKRMTRNAIRLICNRIGEQAGVEKVHPHRFRHTFAIEFLRNGGNMYILSEKLLGHSDLTITKRYLHLVDDDAFNEHHKASPADRWKL
jgi:integrase/recombinase XerD